MAKKRKWLSWGVVTSGLIIIMLLVFAVNTEPLVRWFPDSLAVVDREKEQLVARMTWTEFLGTTLISGIIVLILVSHLGLLIALVNPIAKPLQSTAGASTLCPQCKSGIQNEWRVCPFCGTPIDKVKLPLVNR